MNILLKSGVNTILREVVQYLHAVVAKASLRCEIRLLGTIVVEPQVRGHLSARVLGALQLSYCILLFHIYYLCNLKMASSGRNMLLPC